MNYGIVFEPVEDPGFPAGWFYAHIPALGVTTQGEGLDGAKEAAKELAELWIAEKIANNEAVPQPASSFFSTIEISENALQCA
jgi:predicted RNase H-like HicB family nuclease